MIMSPTSPLNGRYTISRPWTPCWWQLCSPTRPGATATTLIETMIAIIRHTEIYCVPAPAQARGVHIPVRDAALGGGEEAGTRRGHDEGRPGGGTRDLWHCREGPLVRAARRDHRCGRGRCRDVPPLLPSPSTSLGCPSPAIVSARMQVGVDPSALSRARGRLQEIDEARQARRDALALTAAARDDGPREFCCPITMERMVDPVTPDDFAL